MLSQQHHFIIVLNVDSVELFLHELASPHGHLQGKGLCRPHLRGAYSIVEIVEAVSYAYCMLYYP